MLLSSSVWAPGLLVNSRKTDSLMNIDWLSMSDASLIMSLRQIRVQVIPVPLRCVDDDDRSYRRHTLIKPPVLSQYWKQNQYICIPEP